MATLLEQNEKVGTEVDTSLTKGQNLTSQKKGQITAEVPDMMDQDSTSFMQHSCQNI